MTTVDSTPLTAEEAGAAATKSATHVQQWFAGSVNVALRRACGYHKINEGYHKISQYDGWLLERELNRILAVAEGRLE